MKTPSAAIQLTAVAFGLTLTFLPSVFAEDKGCKIMVQFKRVLMPPTNLTPADATALDGILKKYDKSLYKIVKFEKGVKVAGSEEGHLPDRYVCEERAIVDAAEASKASGVAIQVGGKGCNPHCIPTLKNEDLVNEVENLLEKYCAKK
jgi:hypothetical protein